ncbi:TfoX/Sxy family protein [Salipiger sp.]|uniref:TfoX/Sxy family protein n=1 Tax=Salipiger sp. TaxID=2078585 RepID=UPI003A97EE1E
MSTPVSSIRNLGPAMEQACHRAGIPDAETLRALGADETYRRLLATGGRPHFIGYYVLHMALQGRPWNDCRGKEKEALRQRFDALVAEGRGPTLSALDRALDEIGVRPKSAPTAPAGKPRREQADG